MFHILPSSELIVEKRLELPTYFDCELVNAPGWLFPVFIWQGQIPI
jgi:hypothetical protein